MLILTKEELICHCRLYAQEIKIGKCKPSIKNIEYSVDYNHFCIFFLNGRCQNFRVNFTLTDEFMDECRRILGLQTSEPKIVSRLKKILKNVKYEAKASKYEGKRDEV